MIKILMNGCNGKMGQVITRLADEYENIVITAGITRDPSRLQNPYPVYKSFSEAEIEEADVVLDFSNPEMLPEAIKYCIDHRTALVVGTTGLSDEDYEMLRQASTTVPVFVSANMTYGISVLTDLVLKAASALGTGYDIEILEKHHNEKVDSPSGTAVMLANELRNNSCRPMEIIYDRSMAGRKRKSNEIGISSIRGGTILGEHTVFFAGRDEIIEIKHTALSRDILGHGAIRAVLYTASKPKGLYGMKNMLEELI